jgi:ABC-type microcin C transport system duplicated ATPase subunit YejF
VADILLNAGAPFTLGLFGEWGSGKTSIIRAVGKAVEQKGCAAFDVWKYEGTALRRHRSREVVFLNEPAQPDLGESPASEIIDGASGLLPTAGLAAI